MSLQRGNMYWTLASAKCTPLAAAALLAVAALTLAPVAFGLRASSPASTRQSARRPAELDGRILALADAIRRGDAAAYAAIAANAEARLDAIGRLELQLLLRPGVDPARIDDARLRAHGAVALIRGIDLVDIAAPIDRAAALVAAFDVEAVGLRLPARPHLLAAGKAISAGADLVAPPAALACTGNDGSGATVVVLDAGFSGWKASIDAGELPKVGGAITETGGSHGTMCAQVVADVAPGATILPMAVQSFAVVQKMVLDLEAGNPQGIDVVSHSVIWFGQSFGRHNGPVCALMDRVRATGVAWVNASGNSGGGSFWSGFWTDVDKDGHQDFGADGAKLWFKQHGGGEIKIALDWDDYEDRTTNLDLALYRDTDKGLELVGESNQNHGTLIPTAEQIVLSNAPAGNYAVVVTGKVVKPNLRLRIVNLGGGASTFSVWTASGNVYDPASCAGVLTVGAIVADGWEQGTLAGYSSHGPMPDGRPKPEVVAPTHVATSVGFFGGTSAACPHAAGALALAAALTETAPATLASELIAKAKAIGPHVPHPAWGWGRVQLDPALAGWQCDANAKGAACTTTCGTAGAGDCSATCRIDSCAPGPEVCNGADDDCDGVTDPGCGAVADVGGDDAAGGADAIISDGVAEAGGTADGAQADVGGGETTGVDAGVARGGGASGDDGCYATPAAPRRRAGRPGAPWGLAVGAALVALTLRRRGQRT